MILKHATIADLPAIMGLERSGFEHGGWSAESWRAEIEGGDRLVLVACDSGSDQVIGVASFQALFDTADLHRVVVDPLWRGRGIGRRLVQAGIDWAGAVGAGTLLLEVALDNAAARGLYESIGFGPMFRRADYYGAGQHALVMSLPLVDEDWRVGV